MISKNGIRAFSDNSYDYYELQTDLSGLVPKGAIFIHDIDDTENGSIANGCLKLCWTEQGNCYRGSKGSLCGNTVVFHSDFINTPMFRLAKRKKNCRLISEITNQLQDIIEQLKKIQ